jgi:hypothetical protein
VRQKGEVFFQEREEKSMARAGSSIVKALGIGVGAVAAIAVAIQLVPYGHDHTNPPVVTETNWDSPQTRALFYRACADCHSNETKWPWYSNVAPVSWLVMRDIQEGRSKFNISAPTERGEFGEGGEGGERPGGEGRGERDDSPAGLVQSGEMPMPIYLITHPEARLTDAEKQQLIAGLEATFGGGEGATTHIVASAP